MSVNILIRKNWALIVIALIIFGSCAPSISGYINNDADYFESVNAQDETTLKCYAFGRQGVEITEIALSFEEAEHVYNKFKELQVEMNLNPFSEETHEAKLEYIDLLADKDLIHHSLTKNDYLSLLNHRWSKKLNDNTHRFVTPISNRQDSKSVTIPVCSITSGGAGIVYPIMVLPRFRAMLFWQGTAEYDAAVTGIGSLIMNKGCVAIGGQTGSAAGFYGVGLAYGTPFGAIYAIAGYALVATVTADVLDIYPPNARPVIWEPSPSSGETNVPLSLSELSFRLEDYNGDLMSYTVTTNPNIGSDSRSSVKDGVYTVQVGGLENSTTYTWKVSVTDGEDTLEKTFSFATVAEKPVVSNPYPSNHGPASVDLSTLRFTLNDAQGDLMDYTVETFPHIGYGSASSVTNGTYTVSVHGVEEDTWYYWYVNVTDGEHWTREKFSFFIGELGLVGYWSFDDGSGNTANDGSGFGNHGTLHGATWVTNGKINGALNFDGINDYVSVSDDPSLNFHDTNKFSISMWVKRDGTGLETLISKGTTTPPKGYNFGFGESDTIKLNINDGSTCHKTYSNNKIVDNNWHHIVAIWDGTSTHFYIDNVFDGSTAIGSVIVSDLHTSLNIGKHYDIAFDGLIDEIHIYDRVLSRDEIRDLYHG